MRSFLKVFKVLTPKQMRICWALIIMMVFIAAFEAVGIGLLYPLITIIGDAEFLEHHQKIAEIVGIFGIRTHRALIFFASISLFIFYVLKNALILFQGKLQIAFSLKNQMDYTKRLYKFYMNKPYLYHVNTNISIISRNISTGGTIIFSDILINTLVIITNIITIFIIWFFLLFIDWLTAICIAFVMGPVILLILNFFRKKIGHYGDIQNKSLAKISKWVNQGFFSVKETKVMQREQFFVNQFDKTYAEYADSQKNFLFINRFPKSIIELTTIGGILLLIAFKMVLNSDPAALIPTLGVLALAAVRMMPCINQIVGLFNQIKFKMPLFNEMYDDILAVKNLKAKDEQNLFTKAADKINFSSNIQVKNLCFAYPEKDKFVLDNVSFEIPKGKFVGIVGPSGAGKTTFVDILLGLLPPTKGEILVDGKNIYDNVSGWLNNIAYVPQSIYLIDGSIRENIAFGVAPEDVDDKKIEKVLKMAELYDFVQSLDQKEFTSCGDQGAKLSGGQRQRIGIARALYNEPNVLVLDEATSALDNETEKQITSTILKLKGQITIIAIAHRLTTLEDCDFKIKFENGKARVLTNDDSADNEIEKTEKSGSENFEEKSDKKSTVATNEKR